MFCTHSERLCRSAVPPALDRVASRVCQQLSRDLYSLSQGQPVASNLIPPRVESPFQTDPSPGLRDRVKSSQDFTFGHPLPMGEGLGVRGQQVNKLDRSLNFIAAK